MSGYIIYVIDTETTGLSAHENDVIEISASRFKMSNLEELEQETWYLKATNPATIQDEALMINHHKREDILHLTKFGRDTYKDPREVVHQIEKWIMTDKMSAMDRVVAGQNIQFDINALSALWSRVDSIDTFPFNLDKGNRIIDTKMLAIAIDLCTGRRRRYYNLGTLVKAFGVKKRKAHRAQDDVAMTADLLVKMLVPLKPAMELAFNDCYIDLDQ
ncbi:MAG: 3'-5' exonuclease [bacterium]|nr:3'-5' exonuclease [bacterium]